MSPDPDEKKEPEENPGERGEGQSQGNQGSRPRGSSQRRFRGGRKQYPAQAERTNNGNESTNPPQENRRQPPEGAEGSPAGQATQPDSPRGQQQGRRRRGRWQNKERRPIGDQPAGGGQPAGGTPRTNPGDTPTGGDAARSQPKQQSNLPPQRGSQRPGSRPDRRGSHPPQRQGERTAEQPIDPSLPPPPDPAEPVFIGPEFRRIEYPELLNRAGQGKGEGEPGNSTSQRRKRRGGRGNKGGNNQSQQRSSTSPSEKPGQAGQPGGDARSFESFRETRRTQQPRGQAPRGKPRRGQADRNGQRSPRADGNTYVSLSDRYNLSRPAPSVPIPTDRGIKLRSQRGGTSKNWWARRWIEAMERLVDPARLQRGRSYARSGQVLSIQENKAGVDALVQGSRPQPYKVSIQVTHLTNNQWERVVDALSEQALFTAQLLAGEMPTEIESAFETAGVSLFPNRAGDLNTSCSCPDWANPCKHVAASQYILGDRFDDDPFLLFRMRGRSQEQILDALRQRRGGQEFTTDEAQEEIPAAPGLEQVMAHFWDPAESLDSFPLTITPPTVDMPLLKRLGEPAFLPGEQLQTLLKPVYDSLTRQALRAAYIEDEPIESNPSEENGGS